MNLACIDIAISRPTGQFWNIPISIEPYEYRGPPNPYLEDNTLYAITVTPAGDSNSRTFVAEYATRPWEAERNDICFYVGNIQGGRLGELAFDPDFNDPAIEGYYTDYRVDGLFEHEFQYSQFESSMCSV